MSIEVAEIEIAVLGDCRSGQVPGKKKVRSKILKSAIFELHKNYITSFVSDKKNWHSGFQKSTLP
jgi:hypothetical protein